MLKKGIGLFIKSIVISLIFLTMLTIGKSNQVNASSYSIGDLLYWDVALDDDSWYCINHGYSYKRNVYYMCTGSSSVNKHAMFLVANRKPKAQSSNPYDDAIANAIWYSFDAQYDSTHEIQQRIDGTNLGIDKLKIKSQILYEFAGQVILSGEPYITLIQEPEDIYLADGEMLGPFVLSYPKYTLNEKYPSDLVEEALEELSGNGEDAFGTVEVKVNGKTVFKNIDEPIYFTEEDGIQYGKENTVEFIYSGQQYDGTIYYFTPLQKIHLDVTCPECQAKSIATYIGNEGVAWVNSKLVPYQYGENRWSCNIVHSEECKYANTSEWGYAYEYDSNIGRYYVSDKNGFYNTSSEHRTDEELGLIFSAIDSKWYGYDNKIKDYYKTYFSGWQDIIYIEPSILPVSESIKQTYYPLSDLNINLTKTDNIGDGIANKTFYIDVDGGECSENYITTDAWGEAQFTISPNGTDDITVTLIEEGDQYYVDVDPIVITFSYINGNWYETESEDFVYISGIGTDFDITVENTPKIENLVIKKINASTIEEELLPGVTFRITLNNATTLDGNNSITRTTDENGEINIGEIIILNPSKKVSVTLDEIRVPNNGLQYNGLGNYASATVSFYYKEAGITTNNNLISGNYDVNTNEIEIEIENYVAMRISGKVWQDEPEDQKENNVTNNIQDAREQGIPNVIVELVRSSDDIVVGTVVTDENGQYEFNIPASINSNPSYYVRFKYDGINNIAVTTNVGNDDTIDSDAAEVGRTEFNNKFTTIEKDAAIGTNGGKTTLEYVYTEDSAILETTDGNGSVKDKFAITASTDSYNTTVENVDLGLAKRKVDLSAYTDIYSATIKVNGKEQTINYNGLSTLDKDENGNPMITTLEDGTVKYNLYLYLSDYNYRIDDYGFELDKASELNKEELEVQVTYKIILQHVGATVNKIAYYYDTGYILEGVTPELVTIGDETYNKVILDSSTEYVTFTISKDAEKNVNLGEMKNWVEIISYSTDDGRIDKDSAPDNIEVHTQEDDSDDAPVLHIQIPEERRTVSGYVFEDEIITALGEYCIGNGTYETGENKVSDVIVQLVEIKQIGTQKLEYIWQETVTGSNTVKCLNKDGDALGTYTVDNAPGHYTFNQNVVAGDYIVRFIYGDDEYYDIAIDGTAATSTSKANLNKYNGQEYKSTIDVNYNSVNFDRTLYLESNSMARDSEARRLEEMAYATSITSANANELYNLSNTWMNADTSLIDLSINIASESINFGLVKRPAAYLVLEKHITGLNIDGITEATTSLSDYGNIAYNGESILVQKTSKDYNSRGSWLVQTEIEKVAGRRIDITYTYSITNKGIEYIGKALEYELNSGKTYSQIAAGVKTNQNHELGTYLGPAYYTGTKSSNDVETSISFQVEDYISTNNGMKLDTTTGFKTTGTQTKNVWDYESIRSNVKQAKVFTENVGVLQSKDVFTLYGGQSIDTLALTIYDESIDSTNTDDAYLYRSYAAQLIHPTNTSMITSKAGTTCREMRLSNLHTVQSYVEEHAVPVSLIVPENDEFIAETVVITMDTGADKITPVILIISITAGLAVVAVGIVLIKKFVIKK